MSSNISFFMHGSILCDFKFKKNIFIGTIFNTHSWFYNFAQFIVLDMALNFLNTPTLYGIDAGVRQQSAWACVAQQVFDRNDMKLAAKWIYVKIWFQPLHCFVILHTNLTSVLAVY